MSGSGGASSTLTTGCMRAMPQHCRTDHPSLLFHLSASLARLFASPTSPPLNFSVRSSPGVAHSQTTGAALRTVPPIIRTPAPESASHPPWPDLHLAARSVHSTRPLRRGFVSKLISGFRPVIKVKSGIRFFPFLFFSLLSSFLSVVVSLRCRSSPFPLSCLHSKNSACLLFLVLSNETKIAASPFPLPFPVVCCNKHTSPHRMVPSIHPTAFFLSLVLRNYLSFPILHTLLRIDWHSPYMQYIHTHSKCILLA